MCVRCAVRFSARLFNDDAGILTYFKEELGNMAEKCKQLAYKGEAGLCAVLPLISHFKADTVNGFDIVDAIDCRQLFSYIADVLL